MLWRTGGTSRPIGTTLPRARPIGALRSPSTSMPISRAPRSASLNMVPGATKRLQVVQSYFRRRFYTRCPRVTKGRRYAFLPFVYDEAAAKVRAANNAFLGEGIGSYGEARP